MALQQPQEAGLVVGAAAGIAVAAGRADRLAGDEEARAGDQARLDGGLDAPVGAAGVAHRGEAAIDHAAHQLGRLGGQQGERHALEMADVHFRQEDVDVAVDQARHQRALAAVDHPAPCDALIGLSDTSLMSVAFDQDLVAAARLVPARIEQAEIPKQNTATSTLPQTRPRTLRWPPPQRHTQPLDRPALRRPS